MGFTHLHTPFIEQSFLTAGPSQTQQTVFHPGSSTADGTSPWCLIPDFLKMIHEDKVGTKTRKKEAPA